MSEPGPGARAPGGRDEDIEALRAAADADLGDTQDSPESLERQRALLALYLGEIERLPPLAGEDEEALAIRAGSGDAAASRALVEANLRLVVRLARGYTRRGLPLLDLIEEGNVGLLEAVRQFRSGRGTPFSTYAAWRIRHAVVRALTNHGRAVQISVHVRRLLAEYITARETLIRELGRTPASDELAERLGQPVAQVEELELLRRQRAAPAPGPNAKDVR